MTKNFAPKLISQVSIELYNLSKNAKSFRFGGNSIKIWFSVLNFSTESTEKLTISMTCYSSLKHILLKITVNMKLNEKLAPEQSLFYKRSFSRFGTHFDGRPKMLTYGQHFSKTCFAHKLSYKIRKLLKYRAVDSFFRRQKLTGAYRSAHPQYE